jgi:hypothetical protein
MAISRTIEAAARRLEDSLAQLEWAVSLVPESWHHRPANGPWSVARNLAHLAVYEEGTAAPTLEALAAGLDARAVPRGEDWFLPEERALGQEPVSMIMDRLKAVRRRQIQTLHGFPEEAFERPAATLWGDAFSAAWVTNKTVQHTWEHGNTILQVALFSAWQ